MCLHSNMDVFHHIIFAKEIMQQSAFDYVYVCVLKGLLKKLEMHFHEILLRVCHFH